MVPMPLLRAGLTEVIVPLCLLAAFASIVAQRPAGADSSTTVPIRPRLELVSYGEYRTAIQSTDRIFVMYFVSTHDGFDFDGDKKNTHSWNEHAVMFMDWLIGVYGNSIDRYIFVDLPYGHEGDAILEKETGRDKDGATRFPSFAFYVSGSRKLVIRGPSSDRDVDEKYERFARFLVGPSARAARITAADPRR
jgi:hypothetical protein